MFQKAYRKYKYDKRFVRSERNELNRIQARQREYLSRFEPHGGDDDPSDSDVTKLDIPPELAAVFSRLYCKFVVYLVENFVIKQNLFLKLSLVDLLCLLHILYSHLLMFFFGYIFY